MLRCICGSEEFLHCEYTVTARPQTLEKVRDINCHCICLRSVAVHAQRGEKFDIKETKEHLFTIGLENDKI